MKGRTLDNMSEMVILPNLTIVFLQAGCLILEKIKSGLTFLAQVLK